MARLIQQEIISNFFGKLAEQKFTVRQGAATLRISPSHLVKIGKRLTSPLAEVLGRMVKFLDRDGGIEKANNRVNFTNRN